MRRSFRTIRVREVMTAAPATVCPDDSLRFALDTLERYEVHELPVTEHGRLVGIVTDGDLKLMTPSYPLFRHQEEIRLALRDLKVASAMTVDPTVIGPEESLLSAATLLFEAHIRSLVVAEQEKLLGIISVSDVLRVILEQHRTAS